MSFAEYAALARHLSEVQRAGEQRTGQVAAYRAATEAGIAQLGHRLAVQHQRLANLAQSFGESMPSGGPPLPVAPPPGPVPPQPGPHPFPAQFPQAGASSYPGQPPYSGQPPYPGQPAYPGQSPYPGQLPQQAVPHPISGAPAYGGSGHPGGGPVHPELPAGPARRALPATPETDPGFRPIAAPTSGAGSWPPSPRRPADTSAATPGVPGSPVGPIGPVSPAPAAPPDPARELELARQAADAADQEAMRAETLAARPPLLPTWSPLARAGVVYAGCALLLIIAQTTVIGRVMGARLDSFAFLAWSLAGLPALAFFGAYLVLSTWGRPRVGDVPFLFPKLGFLICFLATPIGFCLLFLFGL